MVEILPRHRCGVVVQWCSGAACAHKNVVNEARFNQFPWKAIIQHRVRVSSSRIPRLRARWTKEHMHGEEHAIHNHGLFSHGWDCLNWSFDRLFDECEWFRFDSPFWAHKSLFFHFSRNTANRFTCGEPIDLSQFFHHSKIFAPQLIHTWNICLNVVFQNIKDQRGDVCDRWCQRTVVLAGLNPMNHCFVGRIASVHTAKEIWRKVWVFPWISIDVWISFVRQLCGIVPSSVFHVLHTPILLRGDDAGRECGDMGWKRVFGFVGEHRAKQCKHFHASGIFVASLHQFAYRHSRQVSDHINCQLIHYTSRKESHCNFKVERCWWVDDGMSPHCSSVELMMGWEMLIESDDFESIILVNLLAR